MNYETILDIGDYKRQQNGINEDSLAVTPLTFGHRDTKRDIGIFVVADGAGGHQDGDVASYLATNRVAEEATPSVVAAIRRRSSEVGLDIPQDDDEHAPLDEAVREILEDAVLAAHRDIIEYATETGTNPITTVVAGICLDEKFHYAWVGDSRAYVINQTHDHISLLTRDHSKVESLRQAGEISDAEAEVHADGNRITRALGGSQYESPEVSTVEVDTGSVSIYGDDLILFTSDGLIDAFLDAPKLHREYQAAEDAEDVEGVESKIMDKSVTDDEICDIILSADSLQSALQTLVSLANERGGKDNISLILADDFHASSSPETLPPRGIDEAPEDIESQETLIRDSDTSS